MTPGASVGRIVHYCRQFSGLVPPLEREAQAAIITRVHDTTGFIELEVFGMPEKTVHRTVPFSPVLSSGCWTWPPKV